MNYFKLRDNTTMGILLNSRLKKIYKYIYIYVYVYKCYSRAVGLNYTL